MYHAALRPPFKKLEGVPTDHAKAVHWYRKAGELGHMFAQYDLHELYLEGEVVAKSYSKAAYWYCKAVEHDHWKDTSGQCNDLKLSADFEEAEIAYEAANYQKSLEIWKRFAEQRDHLNYQKAAQHKLGGMYAKGQGVRQSDVKAYAWWATAAESGDSKAARAKDKLATYMSERDIAKAKKLAGDY